MEFLNKIEIKGVVGSVNTNTYADGNSLLTINVVTEYAYTSPLGTPMVETLWFPCIVWVSEKHPNETALSIKRGDHVHVVGRLRIHRYVEEGFNGFHYEEKENNIIVHSIELID